MSESGNSSNSELLVRPNPGSDVWDEQRTLAPENPFCTSNYAAARTLLGHTPVLLSESDTSPPVAGFLLRGRISTSLELPSLLAEPSPSFLRKLRRYCEGQGIYQTDLNTYASPPMTIPPLPIELQRTPRSEFLFDLRNESSVWKIGRTHKQRIKQAEKKGVHVQRAGTQFGIQEHLKLIAESLQRRRNRGESIASVSMNAEVNALMSSGAAEIFQAVADDTVLSSILVLRAAKGGYDHSSGTRPEGMAIGASHFLLFSVARALQSENCTVFNLGGARSDETGLRAFKTAFGTTQSDTVAVSSSLCRPTRRIVTQAAHMIAQSTGRLRMALRA